MTTEVQMNGFPQEYDPTRIPAPVPAPIPGPIPAPFPSVTITLNEQEQKALLFILARARADALNELSECEKLPASVDAYVNLQIRLAAASESVRFAIMESCYRVAGREERVWIHGSN